MEATPQASRFLWLKYFFFIMLASSSSVSQAEYYMVYPIPAADVQCIDCTASIRHGTHHKKRHYSKKSSTTKRHYTKSYRNRNHYSIAVYYPAAALPLCSCNGPAIANPCYGTVYRATPTHDFLVFRDVTTTKGSYSYRKDDFTDDPDLRTSDDDAYVYPDMQIN